VIDYLFTYRDVEHWSGMEFTFYRCTLRRWFGGFPTGTKFAKISIDFRTGEANLYKHRLLEVSYYLRAELITVKKFLLILHGRLGTVTPVAVSKSVSKLEMFAQRKHGGKRFTIASVEDLDSDSYAGKRPTPKRL
jgi:hypothetical protein